MSEAFPAVLVDAVNAVLSLCLLPTLEGRPCWGTRLVRPWRTITVKDRLSSDQRF